MLLRTTLTASGPDGSDAAGMTAAELKAVDMWALGVILCKHCAFVLWFLFSFCFSQLM
jgi:hypothetical protein